MAPVCQLVHENSAAEVYLGREEPQHDALLGFAENNYLGTFAESVLEDLNSLNRGQAVLSAPLTG